MKRSMNYRMIAHILGMVLLCLAGLMLLPMAAGLCYGESVLNFIVSCGLTAAVGAGLFCVKPKRETLYARDGFIVVGLAWISMSLLGALPYMLSGDIPNYIDALFEAVSGFTTTGATILVRTESLSRGCMFWRLFSQWIGGMGVLVFMMAVMPMNGEHSMHIMRAEFPGHSVGKLVPRVRQTTKLLYLIYIGLTALETIFLMLGGLSFYDALLHSFATAGTGGFSTYTASLGAFNSLYIELVVGIFVLIFSTNFNLLFFILAGKAKEALKNDELRFFIGIVVCASVCIALNIRGIYGSFFSALRHAFFNTAMMISTSSFCTVDYTAWPEFAKGVLLLLMFSGACAGSTCGGLKLSRVMILLKTAYAELQKMAHPRTVCRVQLNGKRVASDTVRAVQIYFTLYILLIFFSSALLSLDGHDFSTNITASLACLSNIGPGMGLIGPLGNYDIFSYPAKLLLALVMLLGRLEIYPILVLFSRHTWKN